MVIPVFLAKKILNDFHISRLRISRMKTLMGNYIYWHGMNMEIENLIRNCKNCVLVAKASLVKFNLWPKTDKP